MSKWIRKDDKVIVIAGNDKRKTGKVISRKGEKVVVQGVNICKKHIKRRTPSGKGEIIEFEKAIHISNVALCTDEGKPVRLKVKFNEKGDKQLFYLNGDEQVIYREMKKS